MRSAWVLARLYAAIAALGILFAGAVPAFAQSAGGPLITSPAEGAVVQGQVSIRGSSDEPGFSSAELSFGYTGDGTGAWFPILKSSQPVTDGELATWDTTTITDGDYDLRLRVFSIDGSFRDVVVHVKVRNYAPLPTATPVIVPTPTVVLEVATPVIIAPSETPTAQALLPASSATPLPANSAALDEPRVYAAFWRGASIVGLLILGLGVIMRLRR